MITQDNAPQFVDGKLVTHTTFYGLSTDTKPSGVANGSAFIEMNTGKIYFYNAAGNAWLEWGA